MRLKMKLIVALLAAALNGLSIPVFAGALEDSPGTIAQAVAGEHRAPENRARDRYRHPVETLQFFGVEPGQTVVEIWPGGGWYTEILAPLLHDNGQFYAAVFSDKAENQPGYRARLNKSLRDKFAAHPEIYGEVKITHLHIPGETAITPAGTADRVLTFRNVHNWLAGGYAQEVFDAFFLALKPGGLLGVVEHRAKPGTGLDAMIKSGYVTEDKVIELASNAGFELIAKSDINANPKDTADHPQGVWTLPPSLRLGEQDKEKYLAIGESDRMTLLFRKHE